MLSDKGVGRGNKWRPAIGFLPVRAYARRGEVRASLLDITLMSVEKQAGSLWIWEWRVTVNLKNDPTPPDFDDLVVPQRPSLALWEILCPR